MDTKGSVKRMNKEERRKLILDAAMTVFVEKGFKGSITLEIAKAAGISEVTLFRYFSSKQELFLQVIEPILFSTLKESLDIMSAAGDGMRLEQVLYERINLISKNYQVVKLILAEEHLLSELGSNNFTTRIIQILKKMLSQIGVSVNDQEFNIRLLMGLMLSFLYMPEKNEKIVKNHVDKVVSLISKETEK